MRSFLQTQDWLNFQKHIGRKTWRFVYPEHSQGNDVHIAANIIQHDLPFGKNYLYVPHGPEIFLGEIRSGLKNEVDNFFKYLKNLGKENKSIFVKIEPLADVVTEIIYRKILKHSKKTIQPKRTVLVDLNLPEAGLLEQMHHKTRYNIRLAEKKGLKLEESKNIKEFWKLLKKTAKNDNFSTHNYEYYEKLIEFFTDDKELKTKMVFEMSEGKALAGAILLIFGDTVHYLHGAMDRDYKNWMAPYLMHWEIMKWAKTNGYHSYDFWGIDARKWPGVTRFKLGWGGREVEYPGSFDMPVSKIWYFVYNLARRVF